jgi:hypothetical protein
MGTISTAVSFREVRPFFEMIAESTCKHGNRV